MQGNAEEYRPAIKTVIRETVRLSAMAEAILQSENVPTEVEAIDVSEITREAMDRWKLPFERKGAVLAESISECWGRITKEEWTSILDNLLDNAFKYGGDRCMVRLSCAASVVLEVTDNGKGIPVADRERVFERFTRLDSSRSSSGHGLGLYLCCKIMKARGGSIGIEQDTNGMRVVATLPKSERADLAGKAIEAAYRSL
jgi:signal transduction histidine kinase